MNNNSSALLNKYLSENVYQLLDEDLDKELKDHPVKNLSIDFRGCIEFDHGTDRDYFLDADINKEER